MNAAPVDRLRVADDRGDPRGAAFNMAMDEALLDDCAAHGPVLRLYSWARPAVSFGYFLDWREAAGAARPGDDLVRRWTGGGIVRHGRDFTWSLAIPRAHSFAGVRPAESFVRLHRCLARALEVAGIDGVDVVPAGGGGPRGGMCFERPAPGDLVLGGRKIAGAGQRRTKAGILHQGSLCLPDAEVPMALTHLLPRFLADESAGFAVPGDLRRRADDLAAARYGTRDWLERISGR